MKDKLVGQGDADSNYGLGQAEADKLRLWAVERQQRIDADPSIPRRHRADAEHQATVTKSLSVTKSLGRPKQDKTLSPAERSKAYRERGKSSEAATIKTVPGTTFGPVVSTVSEADSRRDPAK